MLLTYQQNMKEEILKLIRALRASSHPQQSTLVPLILIHRAVEDPDTAKMKETLEDHDFDDPDISAVEDEMMSRKNHVVKKN